MKVGYARVSTDVQRLDLQINSLKGHGCSKIYHDFGVAGSKMDRPGLNAALKDLKPGDTIVVWRLDRLGRTLPGLVRLVNQLGEKGVQFQSITEAFDTTSSSGKLLFHVMAALSQFERELISERTKAGLIAARMRGKSLGRPPSLSDTQINQIHHQLIELGTPINKLAMQYGVSTRTITRHLRNCMHKPN